MEAVFGLVLVMLTGVSHATDMVTTCNASQNSSQCSVVLGGTLDLQLMTNASGCELLFKKNLTDGPKLIFSLKRNNVTLWGMSEKRSKFFINNGSFRTRSTHCAHLGVRFSWWSPPSSDAGSLLYSEDKEKSSTTDAELKGLKPSE
ncbi:hypothetical protein J4Q44_G00313710 [Coregonus suidteri]|uniref:Uncharacterized protein n=1 Tax=Coregonus suidteri TaxID=861788 RepID=A0AAN8L3Q8_9TELE